MLTNNIPAIINEYNSMLRPLKIGEPDSLWNLLSIVRDMYRKNDHNALPLLEIITEEMTNCVQVSFVSENYSINSLITNVECDKNTTPVLELDPLELFKN